MISFSDEDRKRYAASWREYRRIMRLGWLTGLGFLVVLLLSVLQLGMTQAGSVAILILAVLSFLGGFFFVVFLTGFQCPRCNRLYFYYWIPSRSHAYSVLEL